MISLLPQQSTITFMHSSNNSPYVIAKFMDLALLVLVNVMLLIHVTCRAKTVRLLAA